MAAQLAQKLTLDQMQSKWASQLNPVLANSILQGHQINDIAISSFNDNVINHKLGRKQQGWFIVDVYLNSTSGIWRSQPFNDLTLTLRSNEDCVLSLWVY